MTEESLIARAMGSLRRAFALGEIGPAAYRAGLEEIRNIDKPKNQKEKEHGHFRKETQ